MITVHTEVVGSLPRSPRLIEARGALAAGSLDAYAFKKVEDESIREAVDLQADAGIGVITDGELRRYAFYGHFIESVSGFDRFGGWEIAFRDDAGETTTLKRPVVTEKLRVRRSMCGEEWAFLRAITDQAAKVTIPSAQQTAAFYDPARSDAAYPTQEAYLADVVAVLRQEVTELIRLGCTYIQLDAPQYAALLDPEIRPGYSARGNDPTS